MVNLRQRIKRVINFNRARDQKQAVIWSAVKNLHPIEFYYLHGLRTVEPFALGIVLTDKRDNLSLLCWQTAGFSDLNETTGWKLYRVSGMEDIETLNEHFSGVRPGYDPEALEMAKVICCVPAATPAPEPESTPAVSTSPASIPVIKNPPPPPEPSTPPEPRPITRVISHNQLMERFRNAHPQPLPQLEGLVWQEPLAAPFPEQESKPEGNTPEVLRPPEEPPDKSIRS